MRTLNLIAMTGFLILGFTANARVNTSKIACTYNSVTGDPQTVTFESPEGVDLSAYPPPYKTVRLIVNQSSEPAIFQVTDTPTHVGVSVTYFMKDPSFFSDIAISYSIDQISGNNRLSGTWTVDHPPVLQLNCKFPETSQP